MGVFVYSAYMNTIERMIGVRRNVALAPYTTYKIGGPADYFLEATTTDYLIRGIATARKEEMPYFVLGTGANILVSDHGFRGLVIRNATNGITLNGNFLSAASGATIADLIEFSAAHSLSGLEHFTGIPSTVGGALWQNLHFLAPDRKETMFIGDILAGAEVLMPDNQSYPVEREFFQFGYDDSKLHHEEIIVLSATFELQPKPETEIRAQIEANLAWREEKQPQLRDFPSCGSVFKKIEGVGAGRLIEHEAKMKGVRIGDIEVSTKHANYLVNLGKGTATDAKALIDLVHDTVLEKTGHDLQLEISLVGEW